MKKYKQDTFKIIVDIDNTLWDFASVFNEKIRKIAPSVPPINEWRWDFYMEYISLEELFNICSEIHMKQDLFKPFPSSSFFLKSLIDEGCDVVIASHRDENSRSATERFLHIHNLPYTDLHLSHDKTVLFDNSSALVDDAPHLLDEAKRKGLICTGLRWPWNKNTEHQLFESHNEILDFLLKKLNGMN